MPYLCQACHATVLSQKTATTATTTVAKCQIALRSSELFSSLDLFVLFRPSARWFTLQAQTLSIFPGMSPISLIFFNVIVPVTK